jgi:hypothetical protein
MWRQPAIQLGIRPNGHRGVMYVRVKWTEKHPHGLRVSIATLGEASFYFFYAHERLNIDYIYHILRAVGTRLANGLLGQPVTRCFITIRIYHIKCLTFWECRSQACFRTLPPMLHLCSFVLLLAALSGGVSASVGPQVDFAISNEVISPDGFTRV